MVIGRTDRIAVGVTNAYGDAQDLYVETIDPANPANYLEGRRPSTGRVTISTVPMT
jgi:penicillin amidase